MSEVVKVCQDCWEGIRPDEYFPSTLIDGKCAACGNETFVARVRRDELPEVQFSGLGEVKQNFGPAALHGDV